MAAVVLLEKTDAVARVTLNRPEKRNALNAEVVSGLLDALESAGADESVRAVVLQAAGEDFCSGADLASLQRISEASVAENVEDARGLMRVFSTIRALPVPVIAAVKGRALAGGCGLATGCDLVVASASARFGYPEVRLGFVPAMVMAILRRNVSEKRAFELVALGREISAVEGMELGLVNRVFADEHFDEEVRAYAAQFQRLSRSAVALCKGLLYQMDGLALGDALEAGVDVNVIARMTEDCRRGVARFLAKQPPA